MARIMSDVAAVVLFKLDAIRKIAGFQTVALGPALDGHLAFFRALFQRGDLVLEVEKILVTRRIERAGFDGGADGALGVLAVAAIGELALCG